ncbi:hypothetical protein PROPEN_02534 [Proteus penneri ATCC 35198]|nr:hypothetical protein PROPEN_02534 [Proteus penneri ATCC 35198]
MLLNHLVRMLIFLVFNLNYSPENRDILIDFCNNFSGLIRSMRTRFPELETSCVMGFGANAWTTLFPNQPKPKELNTFKEIKGNTYTAVSTPGDLFSIFGLSKFRLVTN